MSAAGSGGKRNNFGSTLQSRRSPLPTLRSSRRSRTRAMAGPSRLMSSKGACSSGSRNSGTTLGRPCRGFCGWASTGRAKRWSAGFHVCSGQLRQDQGRELWRALHDLCRRRELAPADPEILAAGDSFLKQDSLPKRKKESPAARISGSAGASSLRRHKS
jgi:hypothetical protein